MYSHSCDLCGVKKKRIIVNWNKLSLTSDRRIVQLPLKKFECVNCGLVFGDKNNLKNKEYYKKEYDYNFSSKGDTIFFTSSGIQERSKQIFNWILDNVPKKEFRKYNSILEIGCGEGNLLLEFAKKFPNKKIIGLELNQKAISIGKKKGLDIRQMQKLKNIKADVIITYAVIEHTKSPKLFLKNIVNSLNSNGMLIIGQPHQDKIYYDLFFIDHLYHFSTKHIEEYGRKTNLLQIKKSIGRWPVDTFSIHFFKKSNKLKKMTIKYHNTNIEKSFNYYKNVFEKINSFLAKHTTDEIAVFGLGEIFSLFYCYTDLKKAKIKYGIDDFPKKNNEFSFKIISSNEARKLKLPILVCVNEKYYNIILKKIQKKKNQVFLPFK